MPIKGCRECRFSKGGHFLAASHGNSIIVYDFNTGEKIADLRGHNSKVFIFHMVACPYVSSKPFIIPSHYIYRCDAFSGWTLAVSWLVVGKMGLYIYGTSMALNEAESLF